MENQHSNCQSASIELLIGALFPLSTVDGTLGLIGGLGVPHFFTVFGATSRDICETTSRY